MIEINGSALTQWDVGRSVKITGIEVEYAHFANKGDSKAVVVGFVDIDAKIPDFLLQTGKELCVYAVKDGITVESKTFYVKKRERPENYVYEEDQRNYIYELITEAENAVESANQAADRANDAAAKVEEYIAAGGIDGFSPIAKATQTENGAVITITDKYGTTTATVTNGKDGKDGAIIDDSQISAHTTWSSQKISDEIGSGGGGGTGGSEYYRATDYGISTDAEDNTPALQALIDNVSAKGGGIIFFPAGTYNFKRWSSSDYRWAIEMKSNVSIIGENLETTVLKQTQEIAYSLFGRILANGEGANDPLTGCTFSNFTVDAYSTGNENHVCGKAFFFQYVRDCVFRDLRLMGTIATAMGIDFLDRVVIDNVSCIDCGRTFTVDEAGTSGIGIGTAGWENENFIITNCVCVGSGQYGIFIENQGIFYEGNVPYAKGCIIANCIVRNGINKGIGVRGGQNVTIIGCESYENTSHGIFIDNNCKNVKVLSCSGANNGGAGIFITPNDTEHLLIKGCTFVNNQAEGIKVSVDAGKNANKLCIQDCYTDGNTIGIELSANYLSDCVILGNTTLDGINSSATFTGNTEFNSLITADDPDTPTVKSILVPFSSMTDGKKLMPDGSLVDGTVGQTNATEAYIDVSALTDTFILRYPASAHGAIRIAQYDSSKTSLGTSFGLDAATETTAEYDIWHVTKLDDCRYIRIFLSGGFLNMDGELCSIGGGDGDDLEERLDSLEERLAALENRPIYNGEVEDV